jgi:site-specific recombinase XerC
MKGLGRAASTIRDQKRLINTVVIGCGWRTTSDLNRPQLERWLNARVSEGMGARTRNAYAAASVAFGNWLVKAGRLTLNPFSSLPMLNIRMDVRHERRTLSLEEFAKLV